MLFIHLCTNQFVVVVFKYEAKFIHVFRCSRISSSSSSRRSCSFSFFLYYYYFGGEGGGGGGGVIWFGLVVMNIAGTIVAAVVLFLRR